MQQSDNHFVGNQVCPATPAVCRGTEAVTLEVHGDNQRAKRGGHKRNFKPMLMLLRLLLATVFFYMNWYTGTMNRKLTGMKLVEL